MGAAHKPLKIRNLAPGDELGALIRRIVSSRHLKSSIRLCEFLFYTADCAIRDAPEDATEQQIGIRVFNRHPGYNSSEDSIVRTHARLLRQKLSAYFAEEGANEELVVEIPKGHYLPIFISRKLNFEVVEGRSKAVDIPRVPQTVGSRPRARFWSWKLLLIITLTAFISSIALWQFGAKPAFALSPVEKFWRPFLSADPPLIIYSNA